MCLLSINLFVDDVLFERDIVEFGAGELEMVELVAEFARVNLKLIRNSPDLIPQEAIELVIEVVLPEN